MIQQGFNPLRKIPGLKPGYRNLRNGFCSGDESQEFSPGGFNPHARWDRHIPQVSNAESGTTESGTGIINEKIEVLVYFKAAKIYPRFFLWNSRHYKIKKITYQWQQRCGQELISYFSVSTGFDFYQISFNNHSFGWRLDKVIA